MTRAVAAVAALVLAASLPAGRAAGRADRVPAGTTDRVPAGTTFAIRAGRVIPIEGPEIAPGTVVVRGGRIVEVGPREAVRVPDDVPVLDVPDGVVMPGFVEAHSQRGLDRTYEIAANASFVRAVDALNPASLEIEDALRNGITTLQVAPDDRAFLAGRSALVHPHGASATAMTIRDEAALKISLLPGPGSSRMGHLARLRDMLDASRRFLDEAERAPRDAPPARDPAREGLAALLDGSLPALVYCPTAADVASAFALAAEHGFRVTPVVAPGAWRAAPLLAANHVTVVVTPVMDAWERQPDGSVLHVQLPRILHEAGVPFALTTDPYEAASQHPGLQAARAVRWGVPREAALAATTRVPARLLGFGARKGVLRAGADADILLLDGDPLAATTWVRRAWIRGHLVYEHERDEKLRRLLGASPAEPPLTTSEVDEHDHEHGHGEHAPDELRGEQSRPEPERGATGAGTDDLQRDRSRRWPFPPGTPR